ncbi:MAG: HAD family hydrolase [Hyphomicrobiales bacterium]|nr:HAD family hydrolase [Hyphomicrobiales bacterium]
MVDPVDIAFFFDVDNTLLDNDKIQRDIREHLEGSYGEHARDRYWAIFQELWGELGYADYLGALERYRREELHDPRILRLASWLVDYAFANRLYPQALDAVRHARRLAPAIVLSDGDAVFQPRKIERSGLWHEFDGNVLVYIHKEQELDDVEHWYPARHYVLIDDKLRILDAVKKVWGEKVTTVFVRQGHYAFDTTALASYREADMVIERIGELTRLGLRDFKRV